MTQSRLSSFYEALIGTAIGFVTSVLISRLLYPLMGWHPTIADSLIVTSVYTVVSVARSYAVRRWFNARIRRAAELLAGEK